MVDAGVDVRAQRHAIALVAGLAGARPAAHRVHAVGVDEAAAVVRQALVDVDAVASGRNVERRWRLVAARVARIARVVDARIDVAARDTVAHVAIVARAGVATWRRVRAGRVRRAAAIVRRALVDVDAAPTALRVAGGRRQIGAVVARIARMIDARVDVAADDAVARVAGVAETLEATVDVGARRVVAAVVEVERTLVPIHAHAAGAADEPGRAAATLEGAWQVRAGHERVAAAVVGLALVDVLAGRAVGLVAPFAGAGEAARRVRADRVRVAAAVVRLALVDVRAVDAVAVVAGLAGAGPPALGVRAGREVAAAAVVRQTLVDVDAAVAFLTIAGVADERALRPVADRRAMQWRDADDAGAAAARRIERLEAAPITHMIRSVALQRQQIRRLRGEQIGLGRVERLGQIVAQVRWHRRAHQVRPRAKAPAPIVRLALIPLGTGMLSGRARQLAVGDVDVEAGRSAKAQRPQQQDPRGPHRPPPRETVKVAPPPRCANQGLSPTRA